MTNRYKTVRPANLSKARRRGCVAKGCIKKFYAHFEFQTWCSTDCAEIIYKAKKKL